MDESGITRKTRAIVPKHRRISDRILRDIESGKWTAGAQLPAEDKLADDCDVSVGTIQRALRNLVDSGVLVRKHGKGTFVSGARAPRQHLRHFRFLADDGRTLLPIYFNILTIEACNLDGPWAGFLQDPSDEYVRITRLASVAGEFEAYSEVLLPAGRFSALLDLGRDRLDGVSIRDKLAEEFNAPTLSARQTLLCQPLPPRVTRIIDVPTGQYGTVWTIEGMSYRETPITWQRVFVPPSDRALELPPVYPDARTRQ
ncbi:MAG: GntR family transcriptional regulator [Jhaorihella sp.]